MTISFKNVGIREFQTNNVFSVPQSILPIGIKTPVNFGGNSEGLFQMHTDIKEVVHDNLRNLLLTNHGERLAIYDLGANLHPLCAEYTTKESFDSEAMIRINTAVSRYMPFVTLIGFESRAERTDIEHTAKIVIFILYSVPQINVIERGLELILAVT